MEVLSFPNVINVCIEMKGSIFNGPILKSYSL